MSKPSRLTELLRDYRDAILASGLARIVPTEVFDSEKKEAAEGAALEAIKAHVAKLEASLKEAKDGQHFFFNDSERLKSVVAELEARLAAQKEES
jgi:glutathione S-transferase